MTLNDDATPAKAALEKLRTIPIVMTGGKPLADWLVAETALTAEQAEQAGEEYRRFLALALTATPDTPSMPAPKIAQIWAWHRGDTAAWAAFTAAVDRPEALAHRLSRYTLLSAPAYTRSRKRYRSEFGTPSSNWWPAKGWIRLINAVGMSDLSAFWLLSLVGIWRFADKYLASNGDSAGWVNIFWIALAGAIILSSMLATYFPIYLRRKFPHQADLSGPL